MKIKAILLGMVFLLLIPPMNVQAGSIVKGNDDSYSFELPDDWVEIPYSEAKVVINGYGKQIKSDRSYYEYSEYGQVFQKKNDGFFRYPFMVVSHKKTALPVNAVTLDLVTETYKREDVVKEHLRVGSKFRYFEIEHKKAYPDKNTIMVVSNAKVGDQTIKILSSMHFAENKIIQLDFYMAEKQYLQYQIEIQKILSTFAFNPEQLKVDEEKPEKEPEKVSPDKKKEDVVTPTDEEEVKTESKKDEKPEAVPYTNKKSIGQILLSVVLWIVGITAVGGAGYVGFQVWRRKKEAQHQMEDINDRLFLEEEDKGEGSSHHGFGYADEEDDAYPYQEEDEDEEDEDEDDGGYRFEVDRDEYRF